MDSTALNYPSIIEKEDQESYEIEFDFMSPSRITDLKRKQVTPQGSPSN